MRGKNRTRLIVCALLLTGCAPGGDGVVKTPATERAERRAFDGAPPVIGHQFFGIECTECHDRDGKPVDGVGYAPPSPHAETEGMSLISRCTQCHVFALTDDVFAKNDFTGLRQDLRRGTRLHDLAPPVMPHKTLMRENCVACHSGPAAREEILTSHPERVRCSQCHVPAVTTSLFGTGEEAL